MTFRTRLPRGWASSTLGEVLPIEYGKGLPEKKREAGEVRVYGSSGPVGIHNIALTEGPTIVIGRKGNVGAVHYSPEPCWPIDTVYFSEGSPNTNLRFLSYLLRSLQLARLDKSTAVPGLSRDDYSLVEAPVPPLREQSRIVDAIETQLTRLDAAVAALERVQANLKRYRASVLKAAVEGRLVPTEAELARQEGRDYEPASVLLQRILAERRRRWEEAELGAMQAKGKTPKDDKWKVKYEEPVSPDAAALPELPNGWCWATLEQLATEVRNGYSKAPNETQGIRILRICAVRPMEVDLDDIRFLPTPVTKYEQFTIADGDLLFTRYNGSPALVGVCGVVRRLREPTVYPDKLIRVRLLPFDVPEFVQIATNAGQSRRHIERFTRTTAGQAGISGADLKRTPIPLPPVFEQGRIVSEVERLWSIVSATSDASGAAARHTERLRQSILKWAFEGKLADQDPADEPAAVLLERIRAEREAERPAARARRPAKRTRRVA